MGIRAFLQKGRVPPEYLNLLAGQLPVKVRAKIPAVRKLLILDMLDAPDVAGGGIEALIGFGVEDTNGAAVNQQVLIELGAYLDVYCTIIPTSGVMLKDATAGTILDGEGGSWIKILTDSNGEFACKLISVPRQMVTLACNMSAGGPFVDCSERDNVTFSS